MMLDWQDKVNFGLKIGSLICCGASLSLAMAGTAHAQARPLGQVSAPGSLMIKLNVASSGTAKSPNKNPPRGARTQVNSLAFNVLSCGFLSSGTGATFTDAQTVIAADGTRRTKAGTGTGINFTIGCNVAEGEGPNVSQTITMRLDPDGINGPVDGAGKYRMLGPANAPNPIPYSLSFALPNAGQSFSVFEAQSGLTDTCSYNGPASDSSNAFDEVDCFFGLNMTVDPNIIVVRGTYSETNFLTFFFN